MNCVKIRLKNLEDTEKFGRFLGETAIPGGVVCLDGGLGAGKTTLVQAIARGLHVPQNFFVTSPSFAVLHEYPGRIPLYHMDFYRLQNSDDILDLGLEEYFYMSGLSVIEWSIRAPEILPKERLMLLFEVEHEENRLLTIMATDTYRQTLQALLAEMSASHIE